MTTARILIVEDERIIAKSIQSELKNLGYRVVGLLSSGEEAIKQAAGLHPELILMDISLGSGMDGVEAATFIRQQIDVPIVFLTAFSDAATLERAKVTEPHGYILKPYEARSLQTAIEIGLYKHRSDRRIRENEQWLAATLGSIGDGLIAIDVAGRVRFMNGLAEQLTGWSQADAMNRNIADIYHIVHERTRQSATNPALEALTSSRSTPPAPNRILVAKNGAEKPVDDSASPIRDANGITTGAVLVFRDITDRLLVEEHVRQTLKMEAIGRLAGGIAHDFNNIMTVITGFSELLAGSGRLSEEDQASAQHILEAGKRAATLTNQIMTFGHKQVLLPCLLNLNKVIRDMRTMIERIIGSDIQLETELAPSLGQVKADPTQIGQVLVNLVVNAREAMPRGGRLVIATENEQISSAMNELRPLSASGRFVCLRVSDTGMGMPPAVLERIFEPFFTTKEPGQGAGLGLATSYGIVRQCGGHIEVSSQVGKGTQFRVYLPLIEDAPAPIQNSSTQHRVLGHETVLVVEDDELIRRMTRMILERNGYAVLEAGDGEAAIEIAADKSQRIDLLITDLVMPRLSGKEVADQICQQRNGLRVLFMSGHTEEMLSRQGIPPATAHFLHKPFTIEGLTSKVRQVLDKKA